MTSIQNRSPQPRLGPLDSALQIKLHTLPAKPCYDAEFALMDQGYARVCGVDEAGRGPLAGPVTAAAVILDPDRLPQGLDDSKKLSQTRREAIFEEILMKAEVGIAHVNNREIDRLNIREASLLAMRRAIRALPAGPDHALIDGNATPRDTACACTALIKGDARSLSIAAASIVAKVMRDRLMLKADELFPAYGFAIHKGYPTQAHRDAVAAHGPCPLHRVSFAPVRAALEKLARR